MVSGVVSALKRSRFISKWSDGVASGAVDPLDWQAIPLSPDNRAVYLPIPKAANTSIRTALLPCFGATPDPAHNIHHHPAIPKRSQRETVTSLPADAFVFAVVRHPADRILSTWKNKMGKGKRWFGPATRLGMLPSVSFDTFLTRLVETPKDALDSHFKPQTMLLHYAHRHADLQVFHFETLAQHWPMIVAEVERRSGTRPEPDLARLNPSGRGPTIPRFTDRQRRLIDTLFHEDFARYGYSWDDRCARRDRGG